MTVSEFINSSEADKFAIGSRGAWMVMASRKNINEELKIKNEYHKNRIFGLAQKYKTFLENYDEVSKRKQERLAELEERKAAQENIKYSTSEYDSKVESEIFKLEGMIKEAKNGIKEMIACKKTAVKMNPVMDRYIAEWKDIWDRAIVSTWKSDIEPGMICIKVNGLETGEYWFWEEMLNKKKKEAQGK